MADSQDKYSRLEYRRLIAWPSRIEREAGLLDRVLSSGPSKRLLDLGCGTGEHARYLAEQGYRVVGVDSSTSQISTARQAALAPGVEFVEGDLRALGGLLAGSFGGAICLGNTLPHLTSESSLREFLSGLWLHLDAGAPLLMQLLNYDRIFARRERALPLSYRSDEESEVVFLRLMNLHADGSVTFFPSTLRLRPGHEPPLEIKASHEVHLRGWRLGELEQSLEATGFQVTERLGAYDGSPFEAAHSRDLILVAQRVERRTTP